MGKPPIGKCALCGKTLELTFEHIPPRQSFNNVPAKPITGEEAFSQLVGSERKPWEIKGLRYLNQQSGMGDYTLCCDCNNETGAWYGDEYRRFAYGMHSLLAQQSPTPNMAMIINKAKFYPLRFFKQIISMFCSVNKTIDIEDLRSFVIDKNSNAFDQTKYRVYMYLFYGGMLKRVPYSIKGSIDLERLSFGRQEISEITTYPLCFLLYFNPPPDHTVNALDITNFCECQFDEEREYEMTIPIYECNTPYPEDFRSKEEVEKSAE